MWRRFRAESAVVRVVPFVLVLIPWSAVNLADYFLVRRGGYDVASFFTPHGAYGRFAWRGLLAYCVGLAVEWPFVSQTAYAGPLASALGGADISWLVGWFSAAIAYLLLFALAPETARRDHRKAGTAPPGS
jgi:NCS1 family nucleobase:cation symporter-1